MSGTFCEESDDHDKHLALADAYTRSQQTEAGHVSHNLLRGRVHQNEGATDALDE